ncbi:MAG: acyl-CoA synthetase [Pseudomonadota bacterium]|nr:acyl-CoA synthetase [Pseudomonadota bacterium]
MQHPSFHAVATPDKPAYIIAETGETLTYAELDRRSNQGAQLFASLGLEPGDHVALLLENGLPFVEICWAAQRAGLIYTAISRYLKPDEIAYIVADCAAKAFITSPVGGGQTRGFAGKSGGPILFMTETPAPGFRSWDMEVAAQPATPVANAFAGRDMLYSSGTTGRPKGVETSLTPAPFGVLNPLLKLLCVDMCGVNADSVYLSPAPLYHAAPLRFTMTAAAVGATVVVMKGFEAESYLRFVDKYRATHSQLVPTMFVRLLKLPPEVRGKYDISSLRGAIHAAAPCPPDVKQQMIDWWGPVLIEYYAGTEGNGVTIITSQEWLAHRGSVGRAYVGEVKIVDETTGRTQPPRVNGVVYFAGGPAFVYRNDPAKTRSAYIKDGWSTLGDIGYLDEDGYLYLTDRKAHMIISGGVNIYPQETEDVLIGHPQVLDVAVFGIPNEDLGEEVKAIVQLRDPAQAGKPMEEELIAYCRERISDLKCPRSVEFERVLPRTPTGKLMKRELRDRYWPATA